MRITYRGINITYNSKLRGYFWLHGSANTTNQIKNQIDWWLAGRRF